MAKALATVLIGDRYVQEWQRWFRPSWEAYAQRHGYEIVVFTDYIDKTPRAQERSRNWQKLLILETEELSRFEHVVWLDSDVMVNFHRAPCIVGAHDSDLVGLVSDRLQTWENSERHDNVLRRIVPLDGRPATFAEQYRLAELPAGVEDYSNTGVMVLRRHHREVLRHVYDQYRETAGSAKEETPLSYHLYKNELVKPLDSRFNRTWVSELVHHYPFLYYPSTRASPAGQPLLTLCVNTAWHNCWFMHFTAEMCRSQGQSFCLRDDAAYVWPQCDDPLRLQL